MHALVYVVYEGTNLHMGKAWVLQWEGLQFENLKMQTFSVSARKKFRVLSREMRSRTQMQRKWLF